jgi:hypothetical protein
MTIVTTHYRYKRLPRKQKAAALDVPAIVTPAPTKEAAGSGDPPGNERGGGGQRQRAAAIVTAKSPRRGRCGDVPARGGPFPTVVSPAARSSGPCRPGSCRCQCFPPSIDQVQAQGECRPCFCATPSRKLNSGSVWRRSVLKFACSDMSGDPGVSVTARASGSASCSVRLPERWSWRHIYW